MSLFFRALTFFLRPMTKVSALVISVILLISGPALTPPAEPNAPLDAAAIQLNFSVLSDIHMESYTMDRFTNLRAGLVDMANAAVPNDALALVGDNTMNGQFFEYLMLYSHLTKYNSVKPENTLVAMGNHDMNKNKQSAETAIAWHNAHYNAYTGSNNDKPYYSRIIKGSYFIVLGDEFAYPDATALISDAQLSWLRGTMEQAAATGKPIFIFCHQPFNDKFAHWVGGLGEQSDAVWEIINAYAGTDVLFFSGHLHTPIDYFGVTKVENVILVDDTVYNGDVKGLGYQVEVYPESIAIRARNYISGEWLPGSNYSFSRVNPE